MAFAVDLAKSYAGQVGRYGQALSRTSAEKFNGAKITAGMFVKIDPAGGVGLLSADTDVVFGLVARSLINEEHTNGDLIDVLHLGHGDSVWAVAKSGADFARGDIAQVIKAGADAGKLDKAADPSKAGAGDFVVVDVNGDLVEITKA